MPLDLSWYVSITYRYGVITIDILFYKLDQNLDSLVKDGPIRSVLFSERTVFSSQQISISISISQI